MTAWRLVRVTAHPKDLSAPLQHFGRSNETGESYFRIVCRSAFRLQSGDELPLALDERFNFADLVIQFPKAIGVHVRCTQV